MFHTRARCCLIVGLCGFSLFADSMSLFAQMGYDLYSIEWLVSQADAVAVGRVADVRHEVIDKDWRSTNLTLAIGEKIKGSPRNKVEVTIRTLASDDPFTKWKQSQRAVLWFLKCTGDRKCGIPESPEIRWTIAPDVYAIELVDNSAERLSKIPPPPILSLNLTLLESPEEVLRAARRASQEIDGNVRPRSHKVAISHELAQRTGRSGDINQLTVPVVKQLEKAANDWMTRPDEPVRRSIASSADKSKVRNPPNTDIGRMRVEGIRAIKHFRSDKNIQTLRTLLNDPASAYRTVDQPDGSTTEEKVYYVRDEAKKVLEEWDADVACPPSN